MEESDVVMLIGARLNWLLSRGHGKWNPNGRFIQLEIDPEEIDCNRHIAAPVVGDIEPSLDYMLANLDKYKGSCITKIWANGDCENLGEINLKCSNKTFVANTRQVKANY